MLLLPVILTDPAKDREKKLHTKKMKRLCLGSLALCGSVSPLLQRYILIKLVFLYMKFLDNISKSLYQGKGHYVCI